MSLNAGLHMDLVAPFFELNSFNYLREPDNRDKYSVEEEEIREELDVNKTEIRNFGMGFVVDKFACIFFAWLLISQSLLLSLPTESARHLNG